MVKAGNMEWRVDYAGAWAMRCSGVDFEVSD